MEKFIEVRWHGRGGQGAVTAAKALADAVLSYGKYVQAFPEYGPERMGAPLRAYNRISDKPIKIYASVNNPDIVIIVDGSLLEFTEMITDGIKDDTVFIVNTTFTPNEIKEKLSLKPSNKVYTVDANTISIECLGKFIPNTPMLGAIARATGMVTLDILEKEIKKAFEKKFGEKVVNGNIQALKRAYEEVKVSE